MIHIRSNGITASSASASSASLKAPWKRTPGDIWRYISRSLHMYIWYVYNQTYVYMCVSYKIHNIYVRMRVHVSFCTNKKTRAPTASLLVCSLAGLYMLSINSSNLRKAERKYQRLGVLQAKISKSNPANQMQHPKFQPLEMRHTNLYGIQSIQQLFVGEVHAWEVNENVLIITITNIDLIEWYPTKETSPFLYKNWLFWLFFCRKKTTNKLGWITKLQKHFETRITKISRIWCRKQKKQKLGPLCLGNAAFLRWVVRLPCDWKPPKKTPIFWSCKS